MNNILKMHQYKFISFYIVSYMCFGIVMSNLTPFLSNLGYSAMERGALLSMYAFTTILFQLLFGVLSDRFQTIKKITIISLMIFAISSVLLYFQTGMYFSLHALLVAFAGGLLNTLCGLYDTWVMGSEKELSNRLSFIKAFGSIGWAIGSVIASYVILLISYKGMAICILLLLVCVLLNAALLKDITKIKTTRKTSLKDIVSLFKDKQYTVIIVILFLLYSMVVANNCTVIDKMLELGASQTQISLKWSLQSLLEIPTYILGYRILKQFNHYRLLQFSAVMLIIQFVLFAITTKVNVIILLSVFQLFSTPLLLITSKRLIYDHCKPELRGSSQLIALSIFIGLSSLIIPTIAGFLSMQIGINDTLLGMVILGFIAFAMSLKIASSQKS